MVSRLEWSRIRRSARTKRTRRGQTISQAAFAIPDVGGGAALLDEPPHQAADRTATGTAAAARRRATAGSEQVDVCAGKMGVQRDRGVGATISERRDCRYYGGQG